jgi:hypothetical protein
MKDVYRLAVCAIFKEARYDDIKFEQKCARMGYLNNFPLLNMNKSKETVYFTHKFIPIYLVTEALIRAAFHLDPDVHKQDFDSDHLAQIFSTKGFQNMPSHLENIVQGTKCSDRQFKITNGNLLTVEQIILAFQQKNKLLKIYKPLEVVGHTSIYNKQMPDCNETKPKICNARSSATHKEVPGLLSAPGQNNNIARALEVSRGKHLTIW